MGDHHGIWEEGEPGCGLGRCKGLGKSLPGAQGYRRPGRGARWPVHMGGYVGMRSAAPVGPLTGARLAGIRGQDCGGGP